MDVVTIFDEDGTELTTGLPSSIKCDAAITTAKRMARDRGFWVIVHDAGSGECFRIYPDGHKGPAPRWFLAKD